jgi:hypothetical protein
VVVVRLLLLLLLLLPLPLPLPPPPLSPLLLLLPAQNTQLQRAAGPREVLHPLTVSPLLLCPPPSPPLRLLSLPSLYWNFRHLASNQSGNWPNKEHSTAVHAGPGRDHYRIV